MIPIETQQQIDRNANQATLIETWLDEVLLESVGKVTVAETLQSQGADIWSQMHTKPGFSMLRLAMPTATE